MKNKFILFLLLLHLAPACSGATVMESTITTIIPSAAIVKTIPSSKNNSVINPENGVQTGLEAIFNIKTNADDNTYDFILSSTIETTAGLKNGYILNNNNLYLMLANKEHLPNSNAVLDIVSGTLQNNQNIIAYPLVFASNIQPYKYKGELCLKVLNNNEQNINVVQTVNNIPLSNTYSICEDTAGVYEAVITLNIYRKP